jgi:hypothetical protein
VHTHDAKNDLKECELSVRVPGCFGRLGPNVLGSSPESLGEAAGIQQISTFFQSETKVSMESCAYRRNYNMRRWLLLELFQARLFASQHDPHGYLLWTRHHCFGAPTSRLGFSSLTVSGCSIAQCLSAAKPSTRQKLARQTVPSAAQKSRGHANAGHTWQFPA